MARSIGGSSWFAFKCLTPFVILFGLGVAVLYVRLLNGPISLKFLAAPIARSIAAELPGVKVVIEDALVRVTDSGSVEFRIRNIRFNDTEGAPIALAPLAAVSMSTSALWSGRLAPDKVVLIEPRLLLSYTEAGGLSVRFTRTGESSKAQDRLPGSRPAAASPAGGSDGKPEDDDAVAVAQRVDIARLIAEAGQRARRGADATSFLREIGVRNATVILDRSGTQSAWTVIEADVDLEHKKKRSTVTGTMSLASTSGPWGLSFKIEEAEKSASVSLEATVRDLVPRGLAAMLPELAILEALDAPLNGDARIDLSLDGRVAGGGAQFDLGRGALRVPGADERQIPLEGGNLDLRFDPANRRVVVAPSTLRWDQGRVTMVGSIAGVEPPDGGASWAVELNTAEGQVAGDEFGVAAVAIDELSIKGRFVPGSGVFTIAQARLRAGGASAEAQGEIVTAPDTPSMRLEGTVSPVQADVVKAVWPRMLAPGPRRWIGRQVTKGRITGGNFKVAMWGRLGETGPPTRHVSMTMEAADVAFVPAKSLAPVEAPRVLMRVEGDGLEISMPDATSLVGPGRRVAIKTGRLTAIGIHDEPTMGEIVFRVQAPLAAALDYVEQDDLGIGSLGLPADGLDGKVDGQIKISLPMVPGVQMSDMKIEGKVRVSDGRAKQAIGIHDVQGATINIDIGDGAVNATGQMLIGGVGHKLSFQRIFGATDEKQPPLRLSSHLDAADRNQLGFDLNHMISGDIPVDAYITRGPRGEQQVRVRADLTGAELNIEPLAWRKTPGRQALLEFEVVRGPQKNRVELQGFKVVGDDIAIDGSLVVDGKGRFIEFNFPNFSLTLVSRLELHGTLRSDNVWDVKARGQYWDGREFFRQMFSIGQAPERAAGKKELAGVDLKAEIDNILGHGDISLKGLRMQMSRRGGRLTGLIARAVVEGGKPIEVGLQQVANEPRKLVVLTDDAGQAFRLIGFYPNLQGGQMRLDVNLDGKGAAEKTGMLDVRNFRILGDPVVSEVLQTPDETRANAESGRRPGRRVEREMIEFHLMHAPFSVGYNQLVIEDAQLRGPLLGASLRGKTDFKTQYVDIGGSYIPLQGLNAALGELPALGQLIAGPKGEGVLGITFRIVGPMSQPQVIVNPLSLIAPGIFRGIFEMTTQNPRVVPRDEKPAAPSKSKAPQSPVGGDAARQPAGKSPRAVAPEISGGWSTDVGGNKN
jgi:hypothetical protein